MGLSERKNILIMQQRPLAAKTGTEVSNSRKHSQPEAMQQIPLHEIPQASVTD